MIAPVGEDSWIDYVDQQLRGANDLESRVHVIELFREAVAAEPGSIKVWTAYCEYFWSLHIDCQPGSDAGWPHDEQIIGRDTFSLDDALKLWQEGYEAVKYRLNDSHELWNRWISLEMELLAKTRTDQGVKRVTYLFKNRLTIPHATWDETSQMFSSFLSEYNRRAYEQEMLQVTENARDAKKHYEQRETFELRLRAAAKSGKPEEYDAVMRHYLDWEMGQFRLKKDDGLTFQTCLGLYARALTGPLAKDESTWINYVVFLSSVHSDVKAGRIQSDSVVHAVPNMIDTLRRAVLHVPWSGTAWARYILSAEEAGLSFPDMESIKHAATNSSQLDKDGMGAVLEMYSAWCGYLKRTAMNPTATEEAVDLAEIGLPAALEDVQHWGKRRYGDAYQGDPNYRLEKIYIQFLTEKKESPDEARRLWERLSNKDIHADSYDFWLNYYLWEMVVFASSKNKARSPTPMTLAQGLRVPSLATQVFIKALHRKTLDWPERVMEVYLQHCNDYELPDTLRQALDIVHKTRKSVAKRREREAAAAQAAYTQALPQPQTSGEAADESPGGKRKRQGSPGQEKEPSTKRAKSEATNGTGTSHDELHQQALKRDRENTSVFVSNLPASTDMKKLRQYFRDYGHIVKLEIKPEGDGKSERAVALVEFATPEEARSALLKDGKYFGQDVVAVRPASGCTLFVTNYPPTAGEKYIRELFKECGEIFNVRFPSLKYNAHRRFCYVTFFDKDAAYAATKLDGTLIDGKYRLQSKYSDPGARQHRSGAQAEEREIHVRNLHTDLTEDDVKSLFAKHGNVQDVRIPRDMSGKSRGTAFVDMETKEQAQVAIKELDKASYRNRVLTVELSNSSKPKTTAVSRGTEGASASPSPAPSGRDEEGDETMHDDAGSSRPKQKSSEIAARTIAILDLPDTVNDARVRALVEPMGKIVKLTLQPLHGGATVEFASASEAGKAALAVDGMEIEEGRKLRVGTVAELFKEKGEERTDRIDIKPVGAPKSKDETKAAAARALMPPPSTLRRGVPVLGGRRGRGGLGFVGGVRKNGTAADSGQPSSAGPNTAPADVAQSAGAEPNTAGQTGPKKMSPDDFRKLL